MAAAAASASPPFPFRLPFSASPVLSFSAMQTLIQVGLVRPSPVLPAPAAADPMMIMSSPDPNIIFALGCVKHHLMQISSHDYAYTISDGSCRTELVASRACAAFRPWPSHSIPV